MDQKRNDITDKESVIFDLKVKKDEINRKDE